MRTTDSPRDIYVRQKDRARVLYRIIRTYTRAVHTCTAYVYQYTTCLTICPPKSEICSSSTIQHSALIHHVGIYWKQLASCISWSDPSCICKSIRLAQWIRLVRRCCSANCRNNHLTSWADAKARKCKLRFRAAQGRDGWRRRWTGVFSRIISHEATMAACKTMWVKLVIYLNVICFFLFGKMVATFKILIFAVLVGSLIYKTHYHFRSSMGRWLGWKKARKSRRWRTRSSKRSSHSQKGSYKAYHIN